MSRPWMPLYIADYRADTAHLSAAQHGAYLLLIMHYWTTGGLPKDDAAMARIACMSPAEWKRNCPVVYAFFESDWTHGRIDDELAKATEISSKRSASAKQRHSKSDANAHANAEQLDTHARGLSQSQSPKEDIPADAGSSKYAFEDGIIKLNQRDLDHWQTSFANLDLRAELIGLSQWAATQPNWFHAVKGALAKRNREVKAARDKAQQEPAFKWNGGIEGVI